MGLVLIAMSVRVMVGLIFGCVFIVGGEVAVAIWALAGWGGDLGKVPKAIGQETSPAEVCRQTKRATAVFPTAMDILTAGLTLHTKQLRLKCSRRDWYCGGNKNI